jgi:POT family proton-dependent oligopeptide transporter
MTETTKARHPKGLPVLFFTEMWERFGYYLMLGILLLYLKDPKGGFGFDNKEAADIVGTYLGLVYLTPFLGGLIADRILGYRKSIILGGLLMSAGYFCLALPSIEMFWLAVILIVVGNGFFKPNISTLLGNLYSTPENKPLKDSGYNIFYMGINLGAFICNFVAAYMRNEYGWGYAFGAAGVGMLLGIVWFIAGSKYIRHADVMKPANPEDMSVSKVMWLVMIPMFVFGIIGWFIPGNILGSDATDAFITACIPVISFYINLLVKSNKDDKSRIGALLAIFAVVIVFWAVFKQNSSALTNYAETYTDRQISDKTASFVQPFGMVVESSIKNEPVKLISTEIFQSVNPFFIILLTPVVISFFSFLRKRGKEPSTPAKIGYGLLITGLSTSIMAFAIYSTDMTIEKSSAWWLIASYAVITIGELFLSPIGLSLVSKVAPARLTSLMMGGWFLATSIGNKLSGVLASLWDTYDDKANFFWVNCVACIFASLIIFAMLKWLRGIINKHA